MNSWNFSYSHIHFICPDETKFHCPFSTPGRCSREQLFILLHFNFNCIHNTIDTNVKLVLKLNPIYIYIFSISRFLSFHLSQISKRHQHQGGSMPNTSSSVPFLLSNSMQSIRSRRTSTCLSSGPLGSGSGLLQQLGSGMVRQLTSVSGTASPVHHQYNGNSIVSNSNNNSINNLSSTGPPTSRGNYVRKCPSLNITFSTH